MSQKKRSRQDPKTALIVMAVIVAVVIEKSKV